MGARSSHPEVFSDIRLRVTLLNVDHTVENAHALCMGQHSLGSLTAVGPALTKLANAFLTARARAIAIHAHRLEALVDLHIVVDQKGAKLARLCKAHRPSLHLPVLKLHHLLFGLCHFGDFPGDLKELFWVAMLAHIGHLSSFLHLRDLFIDLANEV